MKQPTKAVICAAGMGTRFLPQTKAMPKEMLPIIDRPVIQLIVEEAVAAGVEDIILVTSSNKRTIEDHFDRDEGLEAELTLKGKTELAEQLGNISDLANFIYIRQKGSPKGNALPVKNAMHLLGDEPFYVLFADDFFRNETSRAEQLKAAYLKTGKSVIPLMEIDTEDADKYGMAIVGDKLDETTFKVNGLIEKPGKDNAPSNLASLGGYLLTPDILPIIARQKPGASGEVTLADSIDELARTDQVYGKIIEGVYHDTGDQLKYIQAVVDMGLSHAEFGDKLRSYLETRLSDK